MTPTPTPHDALFKQVFSEPAHSAQLLRFTLGPAVAARIDWTTLAQEHGSFLDDDLRASHVDLLFSARLHGRPALVYVLHEHQSTGEWSMPLRLLGYMHRIWTDHLRRHPDARVLPAIVACVLHHSAGGWRSATTFEALVDLPADAAAMWSHVPRFRLALVDIGADGMAAVATGALSAFVRLTLRALLEARDAADIRELLAGWRELLHAAARDPGGRGALRPIFRYLSQVRRREDHATIVTTAREVATSQEDLMETIADMFIAQGVEKGRDEGRREGRDEGRREGRDEARKQLEPRLRKLLVLAVRARFGRVSRSALARIQAADPTTLERWVDRVDAARSLAELLDG